MHRDAAAAGKPAEQDPERFLDHRLAVTPSGILPDTYVGAGFDYGPLRIYGGHLLGQGLAAAFATVPAAKAAHSLHAHFLKTGRPNAIIAYRVDRVRDGRHYTTRSVRAVQADATLMLLTASFKTEEPADHHQPAMPPIPDPATLIRRREARGGEALTLPFAVAGVTLEPVEAGWHPLAAAGGEPAIALWTRADLSPAADARAQQCALAYLSDGTMMFNALRPHGVAFATHRATSLDHALWFHAPADAGTWLLFDQHGPAAADSRGLNFGRLFDSAGRLVASVAQEALLRRV